MTSRLIKNETNSRGQLAVNQAVHNIVVYASGSESAPLAVEAAGMFAHSFDASLLGFHIIGSPSAAALAPVSGATVNTMLVDELQQQANERAEMAEKQFRAVMEKQGWDGRWQCFDDSKRSTRAQAARILHLADFVVAEQGDVEDTATNWQGRLEDSVVDSGRPVIVHPRGWTGTIGETTALIAWKPTREATRAVHDALPLLTRMESVTVTAISDRNKPASDEDEPGKILADYLVARDIKAVSRPLFDTDTSDTGDVLMDQATGMGADLLVLGAYSHSRLREGIFGGVTRDVIERTKVPALMSH